MFKNSDKVFIGYELSDYYIQISVLKINEEEPETICMKDEEEYNLPLKLYYDSQNNQWLTTNQLKNIEDDEQFLCMENLWSRAVEDEEIEIHEEKITLTALLAIFIKSTCSQLYSQIGINQCESIMFTVPEIDEKAAETLDVMISMLQLKAKQVQYQSNTESFCAYICQQPEEIWKHQVIAFDASKGELKEYCFSSNPLTIPRILTVEEKNHSDFKIGDAEGEHLSKQSEEFLDIARKAMSDKVVTGIYLVGEDVALGWTKEAMPFLCRNRRVFQGSNLFSKGACFSLKYKLKTSKQQPEYIYIGKDQLKSNIGMELFHKGEKRYVPLLNGGENWYDCKKELDVILKSENAFSLFVTPLSGRNKKEFIMTLEGLSIEKERITRIRIKIWAASVNKIHMRLENMGFGDFYPKTTQTWNESFEI
ncbi:MAG: DUF5716 family protein [Eubacteriales bacterium]